MYSYSSTLNLKINQIRKFSKLKSYIQHCKCCVRIISIALFMFAHLSSSQVFSSADSIKKSNWRWSPDKGDGTYTNPIIFADYSDPDVIRVGEDFYMVSSSFNCTPAIPVLHSKDLMNWRIIGHVAENLPSTILGNSVLLRVAVDTGATCPFSFSNDSKTFKPLGLDFVARRQVDRSKRWNIWPGSRWSCIFWIC